MNSAPLTVVIPTFNSATTIQRALDSIFVQTVPVTRVIVVDNASTDGTARTVHRLMTEWMGKLDVVQKNHNSGPGDARNVGWDLATTEYVAFLDSDDSWHPRKVEHQLEVAKQHSRDCFFGHTTKRASITTHSDTSPTGTGQCRYFSLRHFLIRNRVSTPTVMLRTDLQFRFPIEQWYAEDFGLWTQLLASGYRAVVQDLALTYLHKHEWGEAGLSARLQDMHKGELLMLRRLRQAGSISAPEHTIFRNWMAMKYLMRVGRRRLRV
jgi:glycosyltransferase involved in cell wall biosynthesis